MKHIRILPIVILSVFILSACSPAELADAIDDCQNDPDCYNVVDDAINEELQARGITGGLMSEEEIIEVHGVLQEYYVNSDTLESDSLYQLLLLTLQAAMFQNPDSMDSITTVEQSLNQLYQRDPFLNELFDVASINQDNAQLFTFNNNRYILFKTGAFTYQFEVQAEMIYTLTIDTELNKVYVGDSLLTLNKDVVSELLDGTYAFDGIILEQVGDIVYYEFQYDGYILGAFDLTTNQRYEMVFYDFGFDIYTYDGSTYDFERHDASGFTGTVQEFLDNALEDTSYSTDERNVLSALQTLLDNRNVVYTVDFTSSN